MVRLLVALLLVGCQLMIGAGGAGATPVPGVALRELLVIDLAGMTVAGEASLGFDDAIGLAGSDLLVDGSRSVLAGEFVGAYGMVYENAGQTVQVFIAVIESAGGIDRDLIEVAEGAPPSRTGGL